MTLPSAPPEPPPARRPVAAAVLAAGLATVTVVALLAWFLTGNGDEGNEAGGDASPSTGGTAGESPGEEAGDSPAEDSPPDDPAPEATPPAYQVVNMRVDFEAPEDNDGEGCGCWVVTGEVVNNGDVPITLDGEFTLDGSTSPEMTDWSFDAFTLDAGATSPLFIHYPQPESCQGTYRMEIWAVAPEGPPVSDTIFAACEP